jgi:hypothetical protein
VFRNVKTKIMSNPIALAELLKGNIIKLRHLQIFAIKSEKGKKKLVKVFLHWTALYSIFQISH